MKIEAGGTTYLACEQAELRRLINLEPDEFWATVSRDQLRELSDGLEESEVSPSGWPYSLEARWLQRNDPTEHARMMEELRRETMREYLSQAEGRMKLGMAMGQAMTRARASTSLLRRLFTVRDVPETCRGADPVDAAETPNGEPTE